MAINLSKGQRINLEKGNGEQMTQFCVGVNWGAIEHMVEKKGFLGLGSKTVKEIIDVDLDLSCVMIDNNGNMCDHIYSPLYRQDLLAQFGLPAGKLNSNTNALRHTGDDLEGDQGGDDGLDNEIITVDLTLVPDYVEHIYFFLNSVGKEDFSQVPYAKIRMFEGTPERVQNVYAEYNVVSESQYAGKKALIMGELYKKDNVWKFNAIGDAYNDRFLGETVVRIKNLSSKK